MARWITTGFLLGCLVSIVVSTVVSPPKFGSYCESDNACFLQSRDNMVCASNHTCVCKPNFLLNGASGDCYECTGIADKSCKIPLTCLMPEKICGCETGHVLAEEKCRKQICPVLNTTADMTAHHLGGEGRYEGATASFSCANESKTAGDDVLTCNADGTWDKPLPTCKPICTDAPSTSNGGVSTAWDSDNKSFTAVYTCNEGYDLVRSSTDGTLTKTDTETVELECSLGTKRLWTDIPTCIAQCPKLTEKNSMSSNYSDKKRSPGDMVTYMCDKDYVILTGATSDTPIITDFTIECTIVGGESKWFVISPPDIPGIVDTKKCLAKCDPATTVVKHATITLNFVVPTTPVEGDNKIVICKSPFVNEQTGESTTTITCKENADETGGVWSTSLPVCSPNAAARSGGGDGDAAASGGGDGNAAASSGGGGGNAAAGGGGGGGAAAAASGGRDGGAAAAGGDAAAPARGGGGDASASGGAGTGTAGGAVTDGGTGAGGGGAGTGGDGDTKQKDEKKKQQHESGSSSTETAVNSAGSSDRSSSTGSSDRSSSTGSNDNSSSNDNNNNSSTKTADKEKKKKSGTGRKRRMTDIA